VKRLFELVLRMRRLRRERAWYRAAATDLWWLLEEAEAAPDHAAVLRLARQRYVVAEPPLGAAGAKRPEALDWHVGARL
jgi:hypothetical protein